LFVIPTPLSVIPLCLSFPEGICFLLS
jgi:hypothetical protein